jgi:hypothetical protein
MIEAVHLIMTRKQKQTEKNPRTSYISQGNVPTDPLIPIRFPL